MNVSDKPVTEILGVGKTRAQSLSRLGITTVGDMLAHYPRSLEDRREVKKIAHLCDGETVCVTAAVACEVSGGNNYGRKTAYYIDVNDGSGFLRCVFFNTPYIKNIFKKNAWFTFYGRVEYDRRYKKMIMPIFEDAAENKVTKCIVPKYPLTAGISQYFLQETVKKCLDAATGELWDPLPDYIRKKYTLCDIAFATANIHFPADAQSYGIAKKRLVFEELLLFQLALRLIKKRIESDSAPQFKAVDLSPFFGALPFDLTGAQSRVLDEITADFKKRNPMSRLVQGDVGSGKTVLAAAAVYITAKSGYQSALMAPTEILAAQHFKSLSPLFSSLGIKAALLSGSMGVKAKREILSALAAGETDIIIGTHALIEEGVVFKNAGLIITDEQHRFGVRQRAALAQKGASPHILVMTATPIPRTLALILYGDLDISLIDELPPGRQAVLTAAVSGKKRKSVYERIRREINGGHQCYIVCPAVEENDETGLVSVIAYAKELSEQVFPDLKTAYIHGKMKNKEKDEVMRRFSEGEIDILVSSTVIEVGINVPNATFMLIENAERFGLSQLHQLRGRIGRGTGQSYCVLMSDSQSDIARERLKTMTETNDGALIAQKDLALRGPGEFFGTRQHGLPELKIANLFSDFALLKLTGEIARVILKNDPALDAEHHLLLKRKIALLFDKSDKNMLAGQ